MPVFEATLNKNSQGGFVVHLDLNTTEETRRQDLQQTQSRDLRAIAGCGDARSSGTQHESGGYNFSQDFSSLFSVFS